MTLIKDNILIIMMAAMCFMLCAGCGSRKHPAPVVRLSSHTSSTKPIIIRPETGPKSNLAPMVALNHINNPTNTVKTMPKTDSKTVKKGITHHSPNVSNIRNNPNPVVQNKIAQNSVQSKHKNQSRVQTTVQSAAVQPKCRFIWPHKGPILKNFGQAASKGIDIKGQTGMPVKASQGGIVVYSGNGLKGYGNLIIIKHDENFLTAYAHNEKLMVKEGERVNPGQEIAKIGKTGTDCVKLHFEIRYKGRPIDPMQLLPKG